MGGRRGVLAAFVAVAVLSATSGAGPADATAGATNAWVMYGHDASGSRDNVDERRLSVSSVARGLQAEWRYASPGGPVYGTPAVVGDTVYAADVTGNVFALDAATGALRWRVPVAPVSAYLFSITSSVLVTDRLVIVGDQSGIVHALDRATGLPRWVQRPNSYGYPAVWGSPSFASIRTASGVRDAVLVPFASNEETFTPTSQQPCCTSRGSVAALDPETGAVIWQTFTITDADAARGAAGASVWTSPVYDADLNLVYVTTGNNFGNREGAATSATSDAFVAIDAATGYVAWLNQRVPDDTFVTAYPVSAEHPDADFGDSPALFTLENGRKVLAAGQKNGFMHLVDAATGQLLDQRQFLPGGGLGGFFADAGESGGVIYANGNEWPDYGGGEDGGLVSLVEGQIVPTSAPAAGDLVAIATNGSGRLAERWRLRVENTPMMGAVAIANGVVFIHATKQGSLYAVDAENGAVLATAAVGPAVSGPAVANGTIFVGYGDTAGFGAANPTVGGVVAITTVAP